MNQTLRRFIPRAPRYVLRPQDEQLLRFAHRHERGLGQTTRMVNLSTSGAAFTTDRSMVPPLGELIKVEFTLPDGEKVAWWARVVRVEELQPRGWWSETEVIQALDTVVVGTVFQDLPLGHQKKIFKALESKFAEILKQRHRQQFKHTLQYLAEHSWQVLVCVIGALATLTTLYWLSRPSADYDAHRGAPWGQRYKWLNPFTDQQSPSNN